MHSEGLQNLQKSVHQKSLRLGTKQPCNFDKNPKIAHNLKMNSHRPQNKKPRKCKLIKFIWLSGIQPRVFPFNRTLKKFSCGHPNNPLYLSKICNQIQILSGNLIQTCLDKRLRIMGIFIIKSRHTNCISLPGRINEGIRKKKKNNIPSYIIKSQSSKDLENVKAIPKDIDLLK